MTDRDPDQIWGPRTFTPNFFTPDDVREGSAVEWCERALHLAFFLEHNNTPTPWREIQAWVDSLSPAEILTALARAAQVGLP